MEPKKDHMLELFLRSTETNSESRARANLALVQNLHDLIEKNPHLRFGQVLSAYGFVSSDSSGRWQDEFFLEPEETLKRVEERRRKERVGSRS